MMAESEMAIYELGTSSLRRPARLRGYAAKEVSLATAVDTGDESFVQQQFADEVDINTIIRRFGVTHEMPSGISGGVYGDFTGIVDYDSAVAAVERARDGFLALDPEVRERFGNDPGVYLEHVESLSDEELGPEVGIRAPVVEPVPAPAAPAAPVAPPAP